MSKWYWMVLGAAMFFIALCAWLLVDSSNVILDNVIGTVKNVPIGG